MIMPQRPDDEDDDSVMVAIQVLQIINMLFMNRKLITYNYGFIL